MELKTPRGDARNRRRKREAMKRSRCRNVVERALMNLEWWCSGEEEETRVTEVDEEREGGGNGRNLEGEVKARSSETGGICESSGVGDVLISPSFMLRICLVSAPGSNATTNGDKGLLGVGP